MCQSCAPNVQARLQRNNYLAKSTALGKWLTGSKSQAITSPKSLTAQKLIKIIVWLARAMLWNVANLIMISWFAFGLLYPATQKFGMHLQAEPSISHGNTIHLPVTAFPVSQYAVAQLFSFLRRYLPVSLLGALWNPKGFSMMFDPAAKLQGTKDYKALQILIQLLRSTTLYILPIIDVNVEVHRRLSALFLLLSILHVILSYNILTVVPRARLNLKDNASTLQEYVTSSVQEHDNLFSNGSARDSSLPLNFRVSIPDGTDDDDDNTTTDKMDWQSSPPVGGASSPSPFVFASAREMSSVPRMFPKQVFSQPREQYFSSNPMYRSPQIPFSGASGQERNTVLALAPQKYFAPERPTGLENLFSAAVTLEDEPLLVRSIKSIQRRPRLASSILLGLSLVMPPLAYFGQDLASLMLGATIGLSSAYFGVLQPKFYFLLLLWPLNLFASWNAALFSESNQILISCSRWLSIFLLVALHGVSQFSAGGLTDLHSRRRKQVQKKNK